ncbi:MAG: right-handed parallel beta-helix repeat-containing protein [Candidatus Cloacimonetes bacterium]|nr:right-handed parallel beta-helix repeat-containing protein [Candidatus Cloacimonadota bacterium]
MNKNFSLIFIKNVFVRCSGKFLFSFLLFSLTSVLLSIDVQGHISEDATWSPNNNPYIVVDNIFVDHNVTLTVLPGTIVKFNTTTYPNGDYHYGDGYSEAKFMKVSGKLLAEGTEQDSIIFTKNCEETDRRWGVIIFDYQSDNTSVLKHCVIEYTYRMSLIIGGDTYYGGLSLSNAEITISNCYFKNYYYGIHCFYNSEPIIYHNYFTTDENNIELGVGICCWEDIDTKPLIFYNQFNNTNGISFYNVNISLSTPIAYNTFENCNNAIFLTDSPVYVFKNDFFECSDAIQTMGLEVVIKQNYMDSCSIGINADYKVILLENFITYGGNGIIISTSGTNENNIIINNVISNNSNYGIINQSSNSFIMNNLIINNEEEGIIASGGSVPTLTIINNIIAGSEKGIMADASCEVYNNIFYDIGNYSICIYSSQVSITAGNNCFTSPNYYTFPSNFIDLGGNITDDPLLIDPLMGDYHLSELSPCIDTGTEDTTGLFLPAYDLDFLYRIWDGDNNGIPIIDMGCYEFGSQPLMGGIEGYVTLNSNYNFLPFTEIDVDGTISFPDTTGYYEMKLLPGIYELHAYLEGY